MSRNVVLWDGTVRTVSDEEAEQLAGRDYAQPEDSEAATAHGARVSMERDTDAVDKARAISHGALDAASGGLYGKAVTQLGDDEGRFNMQRAAQVAPGYRFAGELGGALLPSGLFGRGAAAASKLTVPGQAANLGARITARTGSKVLGRVAEGGVMGAGGYVASTNVTGDPLAVEGLVEGATIGGVMNVGAGMLGDRLAGAAGKAQTKIQEAEDFIKKSEVAEANAKHFENDSGVNTAYKNFVTAVKTRQAAAARTAKEWEKTATKYKEFVEDDHAFAEAVEDAQNVVRSVRSRYADDVPSGLDKTPGAPDGTGIRYEMVEGKWRAIQVARGEITNISTPRKPPISAELKARLDDFNQRISDIWRMRGGKNKLGTKAWVKDPTVARDVEGSMTELRKLYVDLLDGQRGFPKEAGLGLRKANDLPFYPGDPPAVPPRVELATNFKAFTRQHPETVKKLIAQMDDATAAEFNRVAQELGVEPLARGADTVEAIHRQAGEWLKAIDDVSSKSAQEALERSHGKGFFEIARRFVRNTIRFKVGFGVAHAMGGGPLASAAGVASSAVTGAVIDSADNALVNGSLLAAKTAAKSRITNVIAKYGGRVAHGVEELGPVTSYLATSHLTGQSDSETDLRRQARNRIDEIHGASLTAADTVYAAVQPFLGHASDAGFKIHQHVMTALGHLAEKAPKDPGLDIKLFDSKWTPAWHESMAYAHRLEAVFNPASALARLLSGQGHPAAAETLWATRPAWMQEAAQQIAEAAIAEKYDMQRASAFSRIFRTPLTGLQNPAVITALQGQYMSTPVNGSSPQSQPTGRPPRVQSTVAGSSVAGLIA